MILDTFTLSGKVAIVTGCDTGLGQGMAVALAQAGCDIVGVNRKIPEETAARVTALGRRFLAIRADLGQQESIHAVVTKAVAEMGRVDILVNNAGGSLHTPFPYMQESDADWQRVMDLNVMGAVWASKAVLPVMAENGYGRIVNFGSKAGRYGSLIAGANYAAAKGAIAAMTRQMAQEFGPMGINVNCICPGVVMTERTAGLWAERRTEEEREQVLATIPVRRYCEVDDVAAAVAFLASEDSKFITGISLDLNGGQAMA